jgi:hypothetical protein
MQKIFNVEKFPKVENNNSNWLENKSSKGKNVKGRNLGNRDNPKKKMTITEILQIRKITIVVIIESGSSPKVENHKRKITR